MYKSTIINEALSNLTRRMGWSEYVQFKDKFETLSYAFTMDCPENVKKEILIWIEMMKNAMIDTSDILYVMESPMNVVSRKRKYWGK